MTGAPKAGQSAHVSICAVVDINGGAAFPVSRLPERGFKPITADVL